MATRDITTVIENALDDAVVEPFFAISMEFNTGTLRLWTGLGSATIDGDTYTGVGDLLGISSVEETTEIAARGATLTLSGVSSEIIELALRSQYQGRVCQIYFGVVSGDTYSNLTEIFSGYMDEMNIDERSESSLIEVKVENKLIDLERARTARYTKSYQQSRYPNDKAFNFLEDLQLKKVIWGKDSF